MPIQYRDTMAVFEGRCDPEEADGLLDWLRCTAEPTADLGACQDLHTALAQLLLAARVRLTSPPTDNLLADCLAVPFPAHVADAGELHPREAL
jgi:hypothetical protein